MDWDNVDWNVGDQVTAELYDESGATVTGIWRGYAGFEDQELVQDDSGAAHLVKASTVRRRGMAEVGIPVGSVQREEAVADWVMAKLAEADDSLTVSRTNHGQLTIELPEGRVFTVTVKEAK